VRAACLLLTLSCLGCDDDSMSPADLASSVDLASSGSPDMAAADLAVEDFASPLDLAGLDLTVGPPDFTFVLLDLASTDIAIQSSDASFAPGISFAAGVPYTVENPDAGTSNGPSQLTVGDVDGDGKLDVITNYFGSPTFGGLTTLLGDGTGALGAPIGCSLGFFAMSDLVALDGDGDGKADLFGHSYYDHPAFTYLAGSGDGTFVPKRDYFYCGGHGYGWVCPGAYALGDLNGDGHTDVVIGERDGISLSSSIAVLLWQSPGSFGYGGSLYDPGAGSGFAVADFDGDHQADALSVGQEAFFMKGDGAGGLGSPMLVGNGVTPASVVAGDFFANGNNDVFAAGTNMEVLAGHGNATFSSSLIASAGAVVASAAADFDHDGRTDVVSAIGSPLQLTIVSWKPDGSYGTNVVPASVAPKSLAVGDMNKDGKPDVVIIDGNDVVVYLNTTP
jgi:hypothetical protein